MATVKLLMKLVWTVMLISVANAASYSVGGPAGGWDMTTNIQAWATSQSFVTGDNLVFKYMPSHNVVEVTKADYDTCQVTNPLQSFNDGNTIIALNSPGKRYFVCSTLGHCTQGMKLEVNTLATSLTMPPANVPTLAPENSIHIPVSSPLGGPTIFPFIPSAESPMSLASSVGSALQSSATKVNSLTEAMVGFGFSVLIMMLFSF